jgi:hypothetical protein
MAYKPVSGSWGRLKVIKVAAPTGTTITWTGSTVTKAGITSWRLSDGRAGGVPSSLDFEAAADAYNVLYPTLLSGGVAEGAMLDIQGLIDIDASTGTVPSIPHNAPVVVDALYFKSGPSGYVGMPGVVQSFEEGTKVDDKTATFTAKIAISGPPSSYLSL